MKNNNENYKYINKNYARVNSNLITLYFKLGKIV